VVKALDYYSFGMIRRNYDAGVYAYRYQFNGKENDYDVKGDGDQMDYGNRIYDPRIGRFLSVDPITNKYPELTPYQFASNSPIVGSDLDGLELKISNYYYRMEISSGKAKLTFANSETHMAHQGGWFGIRNFFEGSGYNKQYWVVDDKGNLAHMVPSGSLAELQARADEGAAFVSGDKGAIEREQRREIGMIVATAVLAHALNSSGGMFEEPSTGVSANESTSTTETTNNQAKSINKSPQASKANTANASARLAGRTIVVDENLSPKIAAALQGQGYNVKTFPKGTLDADIITYADKTGAIVLTNNLKDFNKWGITTFKVSENMKFTKEAGTVVNAINNVAAKAQSNPGLIERGKNVSLAENKQ
jgi:RHS repeat-associated protein